MIKAKGRGRDPQIAAEMEILRYARGQRSRDFSVFIRRSGDRWDVETFDAEIETISLGSGSTLAEAWYSQEDVRETATSATRPEDLRRDH
jgi:glucose dehydrogenase